MSSYRREICAGVTDGTIVAVGDEDACGEASCVRHAQSIPVKPSADMVVLPGRSAVLLQNVAHELRAPLSALTIAAELLSADAPYLDAQETRSLAQKIHGSAQWLLGTLDSLLSPSSIASETLPIVLAPTHLDDILNDVRPVLESLLTVRGQRLRVRHVRRSRAVLADRQRIGQVIVNLVSNASKYSPPSTQIDLSCEVRSDTMRVTVADRGPGLTPEARRRVFSPFFRTEEARASGVEGVGLGLAIVKSIVKVHGGGVGVRNRAGGGTRFWFELPLHLEAPVSITSLRRPARRKTG
jgi:two-component system sensor histidine kinase KdpD